MIIGFPTENNWNEKKGAVLADTNNIIYVVPIAKYCYIKLMKSIFCPVFFFSVTTGVTGKAYVGIVAMYCY